MSYFYFVKKNVLLLLTYFKAVREEASASEERFGYGSGLDLDLLGIEIDDKTLIPGLAVASSRAKILSGKELRYIFSLNFIFHIHLVSFRAL
jgi:hypothetical protein